MEKEKYEIEIYEPERGKVPYIEWEKSLTKVDRAIITARLGRVRQGNLGDCDTIKGKDGRGLYELRIHHGPGFRIYFGIIENRIVLLICGGTKRTQVSDIKKAKAYWQDYLKSLEM